MDTLLDFYSKVIVRGDDEFKMFKQHYPKIRRTVEYWLEDFMKKPDVKDNNNAFRLKTEGNEFFKKKDYQTSIDVYTRALCNADIESEIFGVILSNRSAAMFMLNDFENCIKDIKLCINHKCSNDILLKVYIRKIKCYAKMNMIDKVNEVVKNSFVILEKCTSIESQDRYKKEILMSAKEKPQLLDINCENKSITPKLIDGINKDFLSASSAIYLAYDEQRGRHVRAKKDLDVGDVIFVEKAYVFAPVFTKPDMNLPFDKCYNCIKTIRSSFPCKYCIRCIFCDSDCFQNAWDEVHKWECVGMQANLWYNVGITLIAFRTVIKAAKAGFNSIDTNYNSDTVHYGAEQDNYPYFDKLLSNLSNYPNVFPTIIWLQEQPRFLNQDVNTMFTFIGSKLIKHIAQSQTNACTVYHTGLYDERLEPVACAIYPSVSIMNHSCGTNILISYIQDTIIVKARKKIKAKEEIFNCYGIDASEMDRANRQRMLKEQYFFDCNCTMCCVEHN